ncbi:dTDP-4-dehydrorhamnose 3,5-epimerase [Leptospira kanakyensis]|uniref:dTDP-4-dehydrorhamnose 3,5-epimerase n=1 Tax=Leptospira kanakyensis TaxID=2484968 RepID=A0A6N4Q2Z6_9LEPT|nr:dTDP-4-dehydrorhamnose 3,5-epimerase [Leptospira kanakyensis]TGK53401.1 dTDP-4-dehydrorhamnose 3,5-epimerase [Leptospira kanakyensis]TGK57197.1 dTDP-4-dehydrorhamnose 3,5-epimerase [Leptospira kanakyensis]TGK72907.1 dTDP-4-dehydrorhamnose 3,5-epimerase [Leptospira kanakyensis]
MKTKEFPISGPVLIFPTVHGDDRGFFLESFKASEYVSLGIPSLFSQDNHSKSNKNVLRGLHYQAPPMDQGKLVRVVKGSVLDVAVDIRKNSKTYGQHVAVILTEKNHEIFWVPSGFAHGFLVLEDNTEFLYKVTNEYSKESEGGILFNDPALGIDWGISTEACILSDKDKVLPLLKDFVSPFV